MFEFPVIDVFKYIDGDSIRLTIDLGFNIHRIVDVRINGVDTPEKRGETKYAGLMVANWIRSLMKGWLLKQDHETHQIYLISNKLDKYGRVLGDIILVENSTGESDSVADCLLERGFAKVYSGGKKDVWKTEELNHIINTCPSGVL